MSTKIWVAYKLQKSKDLWPLVHDIRLKATENVKKVLREAYLDTEKALKTDTEEFKKALASANGDEARVRLHLAEKYLRRLYRLSSIIPYRSPWNFDVSVGFRQYKGGVYVIPYCDMLMGKTLDFLKRDPRLVDFHYQNQCDKPRNISKADWEARAKVWHGMMGKADQWKDVLALDICKFDMYYQIDPWLDIAQERAKAKKKAAEKAARVTSSG